MRRSPWTTDSHAHVEAACGVRMLCDRPGSRRVPSPVRGPGARAMAPRPCPRWPLCGEEADMHGHLGPSWPLPGSITVEDDEGGRPVLCLRGDVDTAVAVRFRNLRGREPVVV